jgi:hypothetical protein
LGASAASNVGRRGITDVGTHSAQFRSVIRPNVRCKSAFLRRMSLMDANQWRLGHFHNLPGTQRGRKTFRLVLQTALSPGTVLLDVGSRIHRANARKALKEHHPSGLRSHHWLSTMCSPTRRLVKRARFLPAVPLPQRTPRLMKK